MSEQNIAASKRIIEEGFGAGKFDVVDELSTEDFIAHDPVSGDQGRDGVKGAMAGYRDAFPDLRLTIEDAFASEDKVVLRWSAVGTFENEFMGQQPTGERGDPVEGISIDRFEDGRIAESWTQWDTLRFMRNIGLVPESVAGA